MTLKTQTYPNKSLAYMAFVAALTIARSETDTRNLNDPDLNESVTVSTDEENKCYIMTRPDQIDGIQEVHFCWL